MYESAWSHIYSSWESSLRLKYLKVNHLRRITRQLKAPLLSIQTSLGNQSLRQEFTGYRMTRSPMQGGHPPSRPKAVCSLVRKVMSFWLNSKERKLAGCLVGYPDWKSTLTLSFAPSLPTFWCKFLKEECDVSTCWSAHTRHKRHIT